MAKVQGANQFETGKLYNLNTNDIKEDPDQPRQYFDETALKELAQSIKKHGVVQPIIFRQGENGEIILVSGERRLRASKAAKLLTIPGIMIDGSPAEIALVENLFRQDLNPIEEAEAMNRLMDQYQYTQAQLADSLGKGRSTVTEILSINNLPDDIKNECRLSNRYSKRELVRVAKAKDPKSMKYEFRKYKTRLENKEKEKSRKKKEKNKAITAQKAVQALSDRLEKNRDDLKKENAEDLKKDLNKLKALIIDILKELS